MKIARVFALGVLSTAFISFSAFAGDSAPPSKGHPDRLPPASHAVAKKIHNGDTVPSSPFGGDSPAPIQHNH